MTKDELKIVVQVIQTVVDSQVREVMSEFVGGLIESIDSLNESNDKIINELQKAYKNQNKIGSESLMEMLGPQTTKKIRYKDTTQINNFIPETNGYVKPVEVSGEDPFDIDNVNYDALINNYVKPGRSNTYVESYDMNDPGEYYGDELPAPQKINIKDTYLDTVVEDIPQARHISEFNNNA